MGCNQCNRKFVQEKLVVLDDIRKDSQYFNNGIRLEFSEEDISKLRDIFFINPNNETALIKYLSALKNNKHMDEYENELVSYLDVLSAKNRSLFTGIEGFIPSIDIFQKLIKFLYNFKINEIYKMEYYQNKYDICGRRKYLTSGKCSNTDLKSYFSKGNKSEDKEFDIIQTIENKRKFQKISLSNTELYFNVLLQAYFETIENAENAQLYNIIYVTRKLYLLILEHIELIKKNQKFSEEDTRMIQILFYTPIIAKYNDNIRRLRANFINKNRKGYDNFEYKDIRVSNNKLILKYVMEIEPTIKIENKEFENPNIYNIELINEEIAKENEIETLTNIRLMKYIKIQYFQKYNFYTHNPNYWAFNKKIFQHILQSKTIKTLFELLYPKYDYLFDKKENIDKLIDSIIFIPYDLYNSYGITFRKELIIFIGGLFENFSKPIHYLSKSSCFIILGIHEGYGHWSSSFYSIQYQNNSLSDSFITNKEVEKELKLIEKNEKEFEKRSDESKNEGGDKIELLLFGRKMEYFTVKEILFLLNRNSYNVDYKTFRKNFQKVSKTKFNVLYDTISMDEQFVNLLKNLKINKDYFVTSKESKNNIRYRFKRNGEILIKSKCGELKF